MIDAEAQTNNRLAHEQDDEAKTDDENTAQHESDALVAEAAADQTQGNGDGAAQAAFQTAQANETSTIWNWLAGQLGNTPWAVSQAGLAGAEARVVKKLKRGSSRGEIRCWRRSVGEKNVGLECAGGDFRRPERPPKGKKSRRARGAIQL